MLALMEDGLETCVKEEKLLGMRVLRVQAGFSKKTGKRKENRALEKFIRTMSEKNVRRVCFRQGFKYQDFFEKRGFVQASGRHLFELTAGNIAAAAGGDCAAFIAKRLYPGEEQALLKICETFRHILIYIEHSDYNVCGSVRNKLGAAAVRLVCPEQLAAADVALCFCPPPWRAKLKESCIVAAPELESVQKLCGGRRVVSVVPTLGGEPVRDIPEGYDASALLSQALLCGAVDRRKLGISAVRLKKAPHCVETNCLTEGNKDFIIT